MEIFEKLLKKASKKPTVKTIHKIRITIRRLSVVVNSRKLKELAITLGKDRDLDVAILNAKTYGLKTKKLMKTKKAARKRTIDAIKDFDTRLLHRHSDLKILSTYKRGMRKLNIKLHKFQKLELTPKDLHHLRIAIKEVRYSLEALGHFYLRLQRMQDDLGHIHDLEVLQKMKGKKSRIQKDKESSMKEFNRTYRSALSFIISCSQLKT